MAEMREVVDKLVERTGQGRVPWKSSASKSTFVAAFGNLSVLISARTTGLNSEIKLSVLDEIGDEIDYVEFDGFSSDPQSTQIQLLYQLAKRKALGSDQRLGELMTRLGDVPTVSHT